MAFEPIVMLNGLSQLAAAVFSLRLALKLKGEKRCLMQRPIYMLSAAFLMIAMLNLLWFFGIIPVSQWDNMLINPLFNLVFLGVWFYIGMLVSGQNHAYYLIPIFIMSANTFLVFTKLAFVSDIITGLTLIGVFFYLGFVDHHLVKRMGHAGMIYGLLLSSTAAVSYALGISHISAFWFLPNIAVLYLLHLMWKKDHVCSYVHEPEKHHIPIMVEVFKLGLFVVALGIFLMLGTLGVHELGHSLMAKSFGCTHDTEFGAGYAMTHVVCSSEAGTTLIKMGGFLLTLVIAILMYIVGTEFAKRISYLVLGFAIVISVDDLISLGFPYSAIIALVIISAILIVYGLMRVVSSYEVEYEDYEAHLCTSACGKDETCQ